MARIIFIAWLVVVALTPAALACAGVVIVDESRAIVGGNEDWQRFDAHVWAEAGRDEPYGAIYCGYEIRGEFAPAFRTGSNSKA